MKASKIVILLLLIVALAAGFFYRDAIFSLYTNVGKKLADFQKTDLGVMITQVGKEILTPPPLNIGGQENKATFLSSNIITETNVHRNSNNLPSLTENAKLTAAAIAKAQDMFEKQYFEHVSPEGVDPGTLIKASGYNYIVSGENLILGNFSSEKEIVQLWMDSPGHRANMLNNRYTEIGVAVLKGTFKGKTAWIGVQEFGLPLASCKEASETLKSQIEKNRGALDQLSVKIETKRREIERTNSKSEKYNTLVDEYNALVAEYNKLNDETKVLINQYNSQVNDFNKCVEGK